ncbi:MAG: DUF4388 domain-containing protein [Candidatus Methylomirabilia bacterium]
MSFSGDLEHIPLIDVIQLLQQTSKSGTLRLTGAKGECQLGFRDGFIVCANHVNTGFRVGSILVELGIITREALDLTLAEQALRGPHPPPLIALLVETGRVKRKEAYRGLQTVIELTIVEVLTWPKGRFELDVEQVLISDEYRYFPDHNEPPPRVSTQNVLMEALRIFDEKKRDGTLRPESFADGDGAAAEVETISADDLGLGDVESLRQRMPGAATIPEERREDETHRRKIRKELDGFPAADQERLVAFLQRLGEPPPLGDSSAGEGLALAVILFTRDQLFGHTVMTSCAVRNIFVFATDEPQDLGHIIEQSLARDLTPVLVVDPPDADPGVFSEESANATMQDIRSGYPALRFIRLVEPGQDDLALRALSAGALSALAKPSRSANPSSFAGSFIGFVEAFLACLQQAGSPPGWIRIGDFRDRLAGLDSLTKPSEVSLSLLQFVASLFPRALTLLVSGAEVIGERSIGLNGSRSVTPALKFRVPLERPSAFSVCIDGGLLYYGPAPDEPMLRQLYGQIGAPHSPKMVLLPLKTGAGKVLALTYGDFGAAWATPVRSELLDIFARHAGLVLGTLTQRPRA